MYWKRKLPPKGLPFKNEKASAPKDPKNWALVGLIILAAVFSRYPKRLGGQEIWSLKDGQFLGAGGGFYALTAGEGTYLYTSEGLLKHVDGETDFVLPMKDGLALLCGQDLAFWQKWAEFSLNLVLEGGEIPVFGEGSHILTAHGEGVFGEKWEVTFSEAIGQKCWTQSLFGPPTNACASGEDLIVCGYDICAGCAPYLYCLAKKTGQILWSVFLPPAIAGALYVCDDKVIFVLDGFIHCFGKDGTPLWVYGSAGEITSSCLCGNFLVLAEKPCRRGSAMGFLKFTSLKALSLEGEMIWKRSFLGEVTNIVKEGRDTGDYIVALWQKNVIALDVKSGRSLAKRRSEGQILFFEDALLLEKIGDRLRLLQTERFGCESSG